MTILYHDCCRVCSVAVTWLVGVPPLSLPQLNAFTLTSVMDIRTRTWSKSTLSLYRTTGFWVLFYACLTNVTAAYVATRRPIPTAANQHALHILNSKPLFIARRQAPVNNRTVLKFMVLCSGRPNVCYSITALSDSVSIFWVSVFK